MRPRPSTLRACLTNSSKLLRIRFALRSDKSISYPMPSSAKCQNCLAVSSLVGGGSCQAVAKGVLGPSVRSAGRLDLVEPCRESMVVALAPTLTVCDLLIMIMGQLASFGLLWWRRAGRQTRGGVTPKVSAIVRSACVRPFVRSSVSPAGMVVKGPDQLLSRASSPPDYASLLAAVNLVRPRCAAGRSRVTAAARDEVGSDRGIPGCSQTQRPGS